MRAARAGAGAVLGLLAALWVRSVQGVDAQCIASTARGAFGFVCPPPPAIWPYVIAGLVGGALLGTFVGHLLSRHARSSRLLR